MHAHLTLSRPYSDGGSRSISERSGERLGGGGFPVPSFILKCCYILVQAKYNGIKSYSLVLYARLANTTRWMMDFINLLH